MVEELPGNGGFNAMGLRKPIYALSGGLREHLVHHGRYVPLPLAYSDLARFDGLMPLKRADGKDSLWSTALYRPSDAEGLYEKLVETYQLLTSDGRHLDHLRVASIDLCPYGNSQPFRIRILNQINDNHDYFYIKRTDASRVYGLELEHLLSPNRINYMCEGPTLVEEHIIGVPGDAFIVSPDQYGGHVNAVRLSKEFVKFNERCFVRLLGDMRAYNFVVDVIHDLDQVQYRLRSIDFDQQCYEGRSRMYLPQFFKENLPYVQFAQRAISQETAQQYRSEERALLRKRLKLSEEQLASLLGVMRTEELAPAEHVRQLASELAEFHGDPSLACCTTMGEVLNVHLHILLDPSQASTEA
jgi:hypothetical protein